MALKFLILSCLLKVALSAFFGVNIFVRHEKTWSEAREYCRKHHTDLISINSLEEDVALNAEKHPSWSEKAWIGLYRDASDTWMWSGGGKASFFYWSNPDETDERKRCVTHKENGWHRSNCNDQLKFICFDSSLVLVKENKTWEEALEHCRQQYTDLMDLASESALAETLQVSRKAQTDRVWTALRYLGDRWLWVNRNSTEPQAFSKQCQAWSHHCGVLSLKGDKWESWDCADKLNFVCY